MKEWRKILYEKQPFPDNYSGGEQKFLSELRKNVSVVSYTYSDSVIGCSSLMCHINLVVLFFVLFGNVFAATEAISSYSLLCVLMSSTVCLYLLYYYFLNSEINILDHCYTVIILTTMGFGMTPAIRTLTTTISTDTVYALSIISAIVSCIFQDYGVKAPIVSQPIAISSGLSSAIFLLSRLDDNVYAFTILSASFVIHAASSEFRNLMFESFPFLAFCISLVVYIVAGCSLYELNSQLAIFLFTVDIFIVFVCPYVLIAKQKSKRNIHGPWDEAVLVK